MLFSTARLVHCHVCSGSVEHFNLSLILPIDFLGDAGSFVGDTTANGPDNHVGSSKISLPQANHDDGRPFKEESTKTPSNSVESEDTELVQKLKKNVEVRVLVVEGFVNEILWHGNALSSAWCHCHVWLVHTLVLV